MLQGIETVFDNKEKMLGHLKKKSYEKNTAEFLERNGHYFQEMAEYVARAEDKEAAAREIGECLVKAVNDHFSNKKGKIDSRTQVDLNFFMIYYVFPSVLGLEGDVLFVAWVHNEFLLFVCSAVVGGGAAIRG